LRSRSTCNVEYTNLSEDNSFGERGEDRRPVVGNDRQFASLDDVQLFADVSLSTDKVAWTEHGQFQLQHQLDQQTGLTLLEDGHASQRLQVDLYSELLVTGQQVSKHVTIYDGLDCTGCMIVMPLRSQLALKRNISCELNCPHNEMKLKQNSFKTVWKLFF